MTGLNHAATGALVAVAIKQPALALPLALLSHFVIDAIPHYDHKHLRPTRNLYKAVLALDALFSVVYLGIICLLVTTPAWIVLSCGLLGILPDAMWLPYFLTGEPSKMSKKDNLLHIMRRFHMWIQWSEGPRGLYVEIVWFCLMFFLTVTLGSK